MNAFFRLAGGRLRLGQLQQLNPALFLLFVLLALIVILGPVYRTPAGIMSFLQRAAPLIILACGQSFVLIAGGFDLSAGALITLVVIACALITNGDPELAWTAIAAIYAIGLGGGLLNGFIVARLKVPSIIATLGTL